VAPCNNNNNNNNYIYIYIYKFEIFKLGLQPSFYKFNFLGGTKSAYYLSVASMGLFMASGGASTKKA